MRYLKIFLSTIVAMFIAAIVIWSGLFILFLAIIILPVLAWGIKRSVNAPPRKEKPEDKPSEPSYKVIEAEYKIIEK